MQREVEDALYAAVQEWKEFGSMPENASLTTEDAMAMMTGGPAVEETKERGVQRVHAECFPGRRRNRPRSP